MIILRNVHGAPDQLIRMISGGSCGTEDCNDVMFTILLFLLYYFIKGILHLWKDECVFKMGH